MSVLNKILEKIGKNYEDLSPQAKETYKRWDEVLTGKPITIESLRKFLKEENEQLGMQLLDRDLDPSSHLANSLRAELRYGRFIVSLLESPEKGRARLEEYLKTLYKLK